jgi:His-Xaa-Ser system protein HxsD
MIKGNELVIRIDISIYDKVAALKTCYVIQDRCHTRLEPDSETTMIATLTPKKESLDLQEIENGFLDELIDQQIRIENDKLFADTRKMIVGQAFKPISYEELKTIIKK